MEHGAQHLFIWEGQKTKPRTTSTVWHLKPKIEDQCMYS